jgi:hypothetical protein
VIFRESAAGHHAVDVRMWSERLSPGVQDGQEASLCAEVLRIGKDLELRGGAGLKEQGKQLSLVLPHQRHKLVRRCRKPLYMLQLEVPLALISTNSQTLSSLVGNTIRELRLRRGYS